MPSLPERLMRRVQHMVGVGRTTAPVDDTGGVQAVQVQTKSGNHVDRVRVVNVFGLSSVMPVGSDVTYVAVAGDSSAIVIVGTGHQGSRPTGTASGATILYDQAGSQVVLANDGTITIRPKGGQSTIDAPDTFVTGNLHAGTGATGSITDARGKIATFRDGICVNIF